jgi:hypothetical protein
MNRQHFTRKQPDQNGVDVGLPQPPPELFKSVPVIVALQHENLRAASTERGNVYARHNISLPSSFTTNPQRSIQGKMGAGHLIDGVVRRPLLIPQAFVNDF